MNYNPKEFGMRITKLRKELGKTQQETAVFGSGETNLQVSGVRSHT